MQASTAPGRLAQHATCKREPGAARLEEVGCSSCAMLTEYH
jgi:hypothetical protein